MAQHCRVTDVLVEEDLMQLYRNAENLTRSLSVPKSEHKLQMPNENTMMIC